MKKRLLFMLALLLILNLFACNKKNTNYSGSVMLYTTLDENAIRALKYAFEEEYKGMVLDFYYGDLDRVKNKIEIEFESGQPNADVVFISSPLTLEEFKNSGKIIKYVSKESKKIPDEYKDKDGYYAAGSVSTMGITINKIPEVGIDEKEAPNTWNDFLDNKYKGKMAIISPRNSEAAKYFVMAMMKNPKYGDAYFRRLRDYGVVVANGDMDAVDKVISGNYVVGICPDDKCVGLLKEFEDFAFRYSEEDNITMPQGVALINDAANQENGKLLIDYILSKKGQDILVQNGLVSARTDVKNVMKSKNVIAKSIKVDINDLMNKGNNYTVMFDDIFG